MRRNQTRPPKPQWHCRPRTATVAIAGALAFGFPCSVVAACSCERWQALFVCDSVCLHWGRGWGLRMLLRIVGVTSSCFLQVQLAAPEGPEQLGVLACTFHSWCCSVLRSRWKVRESDAQESMLVLSWCADRLVRGRLAWRLPAEPAVLCLRRRVKEFEAHVLVSSRLLKLLGADCVGVACRDCCPAAPTYMYRICTAVAGCRLPAVPAGVGRQGWAQRRRRGQLCGRQQGTSTLTSCARECVSHT